ncbi:conserved hypothetical protein [Syntrophobacter sp. SbD1]|nr:conserved hypothetical protein [Syntrophobacter sp. SbD1]
MKELAEFLKTERLNRDLTLQAISGRSGTSVEMLESFEACDFNRFGASLLIRNTIHAYCEALQIEPESLIQKFSSEIEACNIQDAGIKRYGQQMRLLHKKRRMIGLPVFILFLISAGVFYGGAWVSEKRSELFAPPEADRIITQEEFPAELQELPVVSPEPRVEKPAPDLRKADEAIKTAEIHIREAEKAAEQADESEQAGDAGIQAGEKSTRDAMADNGATAGLAFSSSTEEAVADDETAQDVEQRSGNKFTVEADDKVWVQVRIDDKETLSAMLSPGDRREWPADKSLQVVIGNAGGVHMKWNEQTIKAPRDPGRVLRFRLPDYAEAE